MGACEAVSDRLVARLPSLAGRLPFVRLASTPTPLERQNDLERAAGLAPGTEILVKRDDLAGEESVPLEGDGRYVSRICARRPAT